MSNNQNANLLPCPYCGSTDIRTDPIMFSDDDGEHAGVECMNCDAIARHERWNQRQQSTAVPYAISEFIAKKKTHLEHYTEQYSYAEPDTNAVVWDSEFHQQYEEVISEFIADLESVIASAQQGGDA